MTGREFPRGPSSPQLIASSGRGFEFRPVDQPESSVNSDPIARPHLWPWPPSKPAMAQGQPAGSVAVVETNMMGGKLGDDRPMAHLALDPGNHNRIGHPREHPNNSLQTIPATDEFTAINLTEKKISAGQVVGEFHADAHQPQKLGSREAMGKHPREAPARVSGLDENQLESLFLGSAQTSDRMKRQPDGIDDSVEPAQAIAVALFERLRGVPAFREPGGRGGARLGRPFAMRRSRLD